MRWMEEGDVRYETGEKNKTEYERRETRKRKNRTNECVKQTRQAKTIRLDKQKK